MNCEYHWMDESNRICSSLYESKDIRLPHHNPRQILILQICLRGIGETPKRTLSIHYLAIRILQQLNVDHSKRTNQNSRVNSYKNGSKTSVWLTKELKEHQAKPKLWQLEGFLLSFIRLLPHK